MADRGAGLRPERIVGPAGPPLPPEARIVPSGSRFEGPPGAASKLAPAIFLDRDGTLMVERELVSSPDQVALLPGVGDALAALRRAGYRLLVVTNQSALASGRLDRAQLARVHAALQARLAAVGASLDGLYFCADPPNPERDALEPLARRKPGAGMLLEAAAEHGLDLARSFMIGDQPRDALAGRRAGCRASYLVRTGRAPLPPDAAGQADGLFDDLAAAARFILGNELGAPSEKP